MNEEAAPAEPVPPDIYLFKVSMKHLALASPRAKLVLQGPFKESSPHESDGLLRCIVFLNPSVDKEAHLRGLSTRIFNFGEDAITLKPNWNDDFVKGYVINIDKQTFETLRKHEDARITEEVKEIFEKKTTTTQ